MNCNQVDTSNSPEYQRSVNQKLIIMKGIFHNMEGGKEIEKTNPAFSELEGNHMLANQFLSAVVFELAIKSMWELSHAKVFGDTEIQKYRHSIHKVYPCLKKDFREFISNTYKAEVVYCRNTLQEILNSDQGKNHTEDRRIFILSCQYFSLKECLEGNSHIIMHGKYEFQQENKINIITGIIPNSTCDNDLVDCSQPSSCSAPNNDLVDCCRQPSPFLTKIIEYIQTQLYSPDYVKNLP